MTGFNSPLQPMPFSNSPQVRVLDVGGGRRRRHKKSCKPCKKHRRHRTRRHRGGALPVGYQDVHGGGGKRRRRRSHRKRSCKHHRRHRRTTRK